MLEQSWLSLAAWVAAVQGSLRLAPCSPVVERTEAPSPLGVVAGVGTNSR